MLEEQTADRAVIDRLHVNYHVDGGNAAARADLERVLHGAFDRRLSAVIKEVMARVEPQGSTAVYRIRRVEATTILSADGSIDPMAEATLADQWASSIGARLAREIAHGVSGNVVRFGSMAEYLAAFLADVCAGSAGAHWYFSDMAHVADLPAGRAAVHVLGGKAGVAIDVLGRLQRAGYLDTLLGSLDEDDARELWGSVLGFSTNELPRVRAADVDLLSVVRHAIEGCGAGPVQTSLQRARLAIRAYLAVVARNPSLAHSQDVADTIRAVFLVASIFSSVPADWLRHPVVNPALEANLQDSTARIMRWLADAATSAGQGSARELVDIAGLVTPGAHSAAGPNEGALFQTDWAGLALVIPALLRLKMPGSWQEFPSHSAAASTQLFVYLTLCAIAGPDARRRGVAGDPALLSLAGLEGIPPPSELSLLSPSSPIDAAQWSGKVTALQGEQRDLVAGTRLHADHTAIVLRDIVSGRWIMSGAFPGASVDLEAAGVRADTIRSLYADDPQVVRLPGLRPDVLIPPASAASHDTMTRARERLVWEMDHLWIMDSFEVHPSVAMAIALSAMIAVRDIASRMHGFESSSLGYLVRNVFQAGGTVRVGDQWIDVSIGSSPLQIVLRMAGMDGETGSVPWLGGRRLSISLAR